MSFKLSKQEIAQRNAFADKLTSEEEKLEDAVSEFNSKLSTMSYVLKKQVAAYNELLVEARDFVEGIVAQADDEISDRSEAWQDGEKGQLAFEWRNAWQDIDLEDVEFDLPDDIDYPGYTHGNDLADAPDSAEG